MWCHLEEPDEESDIVDSTGKRIWYRVLLRDKKISFVLQHDLDHDMQNVFLAIAARHGLAPAIPTHLLSGVQIVGPYNAPSRTDV